MQSKLKKLKKRLTKNEKLRRINKAIRRIEGRNIIQEKDYVPPLFNINDTRILLCSKFGISVKQFRKLQHIR